MRGRTLSARLFFWFLGAIILGLGASAVTFHLLDSSEEAPTAIVSRTVQNHLVRRWDNPTARDAYIAQLRENTGLDVRLRTDIADLPTRLGRGRGHGVVLEQESAFIPIMRNGELLGAIEYHGVVPNHRLERFALALLVAFAMLGIGARRVAKRLSRPVEDVARVAERFGAGDLTARTGTELARRHWVSDEVHELGVTFDSMADRIERIVRDQRELLAAISHELRSPLSRARVGLEIVADRAALRGSDDDKSRFAQIDRELVSVDAILNDLLASARAGLSDLRRADVSLDAFLRRSVAESDGVALVVSPAAQDALVSIDEALMARAVSNVIANAKNYGGANVHIDVLAERDGAFVAITFTDDGPGFPADLLPRAFDPFVRGDVARTPGADKSTGLGLALVRRIVEAHGGRATAKNRANDDPSAITRGAEVTMFLPVAVAPV